MERKKVASLALEYFLEDICATSWKPIIGCNCPNKCIAFTDEEIERIIK